MADNFPLRAAAVSAVREPIRSASSGTASRKPQRGASVASLSYVDLYHLEELYESDSDGCALHLQVVFDPVHGPIGPHAGSIYDGTLIRLLGSPMLGRLRRAYHSSDLSEEQVPIFVQRVMGAIGMLLRATHPSPLSQNTWGDGLFARMRSRRPLTRPAVRTRARTRHTRCRRSVQTVTGETSRNAHGNVG
jgi:hypothetical protein